MRESKLSRCDALIRQMAADGATAVSIAGRIGASIVATRSYILRHRIREPLARCAAPKLAMVQVSYLRECLCVDLDTGRLTWKSRPRRHFIGSEQHTRFNALMAGQPADESVFQLNGYRRVRITVDGTRFCLIAHRVVFALVHGRWPDLTIDHIDGDRTNNAPTNLREVTITDNCRFGAERRRVA